MTPIKVAFLWHQHQPFYLSGEQGKFLLPWVRLHATKDYLEMAQHLERYPAMRATINFVPSLIEQLRYYENGRLDTLQLVCRKPAKDLNEDERHFLLRECFHADRDRLIARSHRFMELLEMRAFHDRWKAQDFRDLIVHYHLAWTGEFERGKEFFNALIQQDRDYSEEQKDLLFTAQDLILRKIIPLHRQLHAGGQIELSTSPLCHPILPLLCDIASAREALPNLALPHQAIGNIISANAQVAGGIRSHEATFGTKPIGMWPSEGAISDHALDIMMRHGLSWTASDEAVLFNSINHRENANLPREYGEYEKYFPRKFARGESAIAIFFRDHTLSDKIGFDYQKLDAAEAVNDFVAHLERIRSEILHHFGDQVLSHACISVILDGENCWEYYEKNGFDFLDKLYSALTTNPHIRPTTFSGYVEELKDHLRPLHHVVPGSWIYGDLRIWVGHAEKNRAWELLAGAWELEAGSEAAAYDVALARAEGSDWFWWYGDDHVSGQKPIFDRLFREHLREVYRLHGVDIPPELYMPIADQVGHTQTANAEYGSMHKTSG